MNTTVTALNALINCATPTTPVLVATPVTHSTIDILRQCSEAGWLRRLDSALAAFVAELDPAAPPALLVASALLAHMEGRGHTCLPLDALVGKPNAMLGWPAEAQPALDALWSSLPSSVPDWVAALQRSPVVMRADQEGAPATNAGCPLVLDGLDPPRLYLRRYWHHERSIAEQFLARGAPTEAVDEAMAVQWLNRLFAPRDETVDWQKLACALALRGRLTIITGGPGTGKTYTAARLLALLFAVAPQPQLLRVALAAPTGKAAARLKQSIDNSLVSLHESLGLHLDLPALTQRIGAARTLHALLGARPDTRAFRFNASQPLDVDVLIVDEASMIHLEMMAALLVALPASARVIFLGDKDQLASVEAGAVLGDLCRDAERGRYNPETAGYIARVTGQVLPQNRLDASGTAPALAQQTVMLRKSHRFGGPIGQLALAVNQGHGERAHDLLVNDASGSLHIEEGGHHDRVLRLALQGRAGSDVCYRQYLACVADRPVGADSDAHLGWVRRVLTAFERFRLLCAVRDGEWGTNSLNRAIEKALAEAGLLNRRGEWYAGRPVIVTRNDAGLGVFNGDIGIALESVTPGAGLRVYFTDGEQVRSVGVSRLVHVETAFAMTVHKAQGSEFEHTALVLPAQLSSVMSRELIYTGITRARKAFTLIAGYPGILNQAVQQITHRASGLHSLMNKQPDA